MDSKKAINNITNLLANGDYFSLTGQLIEDLKASDLDVSLFDNDCMTSCLIYSNFDCEDFAKELKAKALSGQNTHVALTNFNRRMDAVKNFLTGIKNKGLTISDIAEHANDYPFESENAKQVFEKYLQEFKDFELNDETALTPILTSIVAAKIDNAFDSTEEANEFEKSLEPLVIAILENEKSLMKQKITPELQVAELKDQVIRLFASRNTEESEFQDAKNYFHDLALANYASSIVDKRNLWSVGTSQESQMPMMFIDEDGDTMQFVGNGEYIPQLKICDALSRCDESGYLTAIKLLQEKPVDGNENANAAPEKIAKLLMKMLFIADGLGLEVGEDFVFAVTNPLVDVLHSIKYKSKVDELVKTALTEAQKILKQEKAIDYSVSHGTISAQTATPVTLIPTDAVVLTKEEFKSKIKSVPTPFKKSASEVRLATMDEVKKIISKIVKQYNSAAGLELAKAATATKRAKKKSNKVGKKAMEGKEQIAAGQTAISQDASEVKQIIEQLIYDLGKPGTKKYIKATIGGEDVKNKAKDVLTQKEIDEIIQILIDLEVEDFNGVQKDWNSKKKELVEQISGPIEAIVHRMPKSKDELIARETAEDSIIETKTVTEQSETNETQSEQ